MKNAAAANRCVFENNCILSAVDGFAENDETKRSALPVHPPVEQRLDMLKSLFADRSA